uniref:Uncharacterized protein n=1 Tax=Meloidogyne javanica TaxID=6303 RepID=A0A915N0K2_MELJA
MGRQMRMKGKTKMFLLFDLFWIALILVSFFDTNGAVDPKEKPTTIQNNLAFAAFPSTNESKRYKFNEVEGFEDWRIKQLINIAEIDNSTGQPRGSTQSNDVILFEEFQYILNPENLDKIEKYFTKNIKIGATEFIEIYAKAVESITKKSEKFISENFDNETKCEPKDAEDVLMDKELDKAINEKIYEEHLKNKAMENLDRKEYKNAIVEGAGPVGLYATYKLFI